ncbi:MAG: CMP-N-acetylneuraminic acid synthetase [Paraglaciecola sp.]|jgi:CMP-N-acetylneuraminic acid synthetase
MSVIATICARGGSQGVPRKNILNLLGKPLIVYTIEQAISCSAIDHVYVSTDDQEIAEVARQAGAEVPFLRPAELATGKTAKLPVIKHLVEWIEKSGVKVDIIVDLDPTSPLRNIADINACINGLTPDVDVVITGYESDKNPYFNMVEASANGLVDLVKTFPGGVTSRQQAPAVFSMNASIYVWHRLSFYKGLWGGKAKLHKMPRERSIDIDSPIDFKLVEILMQEKLDCV